jgi:hypothetical protein
MDNKVRIVAGVLLLFLILFLSYEEIQKLESSERDIDANLRTLPPGGEQTTGISGISEKEIPQYVKEAQCGSLFMETGFCAGTCPRGTCKQRDRSCYCVV